MLLEPASPAHAAAEVREGERPVRRVCLIVNPAAACGRARRLGERAQAALAAAGVAVTRRFTAGPGDAAAYATAALDEGADVVAACGGDGTVHEVVQALAGTPGRLAVLPGGRGNDLARALGVPREAGPWARMVVAGVTRRLDVGAAGARRFATVATLGFDAAVSARAARGLWMLRGTAAYVAATLLTLRRFVPPTVEVRAARRQFRGRILLAATANTAMYGGGLRIAPGALPDDGQFRVCLIREVPRRTVLRFVPWTLAGTHTRHPAVELWDTPFLEVEAVPPCDLYADGEWIGRTPIRLEVLPGALNVIVSAGLPGPG